MNCLSIWSGDQVIAQKGVATPARLSRLAKISVSLGTFTILLAALSERLQHCPSGREANCSLPSADEFTSVLGRVLYCQLLCRNDKFLVARRINQYFGLCSDGKASVARAMMSALSEFLAG